MREILPGDPLWRLITSQPRRIVYHFTEKDNYGGCQDCDAMVILPGMFTEEEIEELRALDAHDYEYGYGHTIANFLPDHLRPADVEKM